MTGPTDYSSASSGLCNCSSPSHNTDLGFRVQGLGLRWVWGLGFKGWAVDLASVSRLVPFLQWPARVLCRAFVDTTPSSVPKPPKP